ncbi:MAG: radical SAM protein [Candidatus Bathyarchaeia archaeon]|nr:radical SAM protein [Candidatus Bathyarchaeota archaeon]
MDISSFVVNPSINVSPYCYSIFRIEPYTTCEYRCVYCFGRWYRQEDLKEGGKGVILSLKRILKFLRKGLRSIPFRLSTLVDPFQPREEAMQVSRRVMALCLKHEVPIIVNTKSTLLLKRDVMNILRELCGKGLVLVQISLSTINPDISSVLEPNAPPPESRLNAAEKLSDEGIPAVIRLQPFIPGVTECEAEEIVEQAHYAGVRQIIVEVLRDEKTNWHLYQKVAYNESIYRDQNIWTSYSPSTKVPSQILRPNVEWRRKVYLGIRDLCIKYGVEFSTCKEGFYNYHTAENCCGMHFLERGRYILRPTLSEAWEFYKRRGRVPGFSELIDNLSEGYLFGEAVKCYPRPLRKKIMSHEKILREVLDERRNELISLLPALSIQ